VYEDELNQKTAKFFSSRAMPRTVISSCAEHRSVHHRKCGKLGKMWLVSLSLPAMFAIYGNWAIICPYHLPKPFQPRKDGLSKIRLAKEARQLVDNTPLHRKVVSQTDMQVVSLQKIKDSSLLRFHAFHQRSVGREADAKETRTRDLPEGAYKQGARFPKKSRRDLPVSWSWC
jgi:hypothetical protein